MWATHNVEIWEFTNCFPEHLAQMEFDGWENLGENRPYLGGWVTFLLRRRIS